MFTEDYYDELLESLTDRVATRIQSEMSVPDAFLRTVTDDRVLAELMQPEVAQSVETHGYHAPRFNSARSIRRGLERVHPERPADCEDAAYAYDVLFQDVQMLLEEQDRNAS